MRAQEAITKTGLAAAGDAFELAGGIYQARGIVHSHSGLSFTVSSLGPDGATWQAMFTALTTSGVQGPLYLPPGQYRFDVSGTPGTGETWDAALARVPNE